MNIFSCKIILADHKKKDGMKCVYFQAIIDRMSARVGLGFYIEEQYFDRGRIKKNTSQCREF